MRWSLISRDIPTLKMVMGTLEPLVSSEGRSRYSSSSFLLKSPNNPSTSTYKSSTIWGQVSPRAGPVTAESWQLWE